MIGELGGIWQNAKMNLPFYSTLTSGEMDYMVGALKDAEREIRKHPTNPSGA